MRPLVRTLLIVIGAFFALAGGCGISEDPAADDVPAEDLDEGDLNLSDDEFDDEEFDDEDVALGDDEDDECVDCEDEVAPLDSGPPLICEAAKEPSCDWEPALHENVWAVYGDLEPASDWQTDPETSHRGDNPNPPLTFFLIDLPDGAVAAPGDWALLGVQGEGVALEGFTEGLDPRDPGCAPADPVEAGAFLTGPGRRNVLAVDGWSTCLFETTPGGALWAYAYEGNEGGLFDYWGQTTFQDERIGYWIDVQPDGVTGHGPEGQSFPIVGDFDGDGRDDLRWSDVLP